MSKPVSVKISKSTKPEKKMMAVFQLDNGRSRTTHFGARGMEDYTKTKNKEQRKRYLDRHRKRENWDAPMTAGALSRWILWDKETKAASITSYKKRFSLK
tara:strand:+ start:1272 stop:1571 length:300 start_codon:yes stop_codon:yes gene_type:complete